MLRTTIVFIFHYTHTVLYYIYTIRNRLLLYRTSMSQPTFWNSTTKKRTEWPFFPKYSPISVSNLKDNKTIYHRYLCEKTIDLGIFSDFHNPQSTTTNNNNNKNLKIRCFYNKQQISPQINSLILLLHFAFSKIYSALLEKIDSTKVGFLYRRILRYLRSLQPLTHQTQQEEKGIKQKNGAFQ